MTTEQNAPTAPKGTRSPTACPFPVGLELGWRGTPDAQCGAEPAPRAPEKRATGRKSTYCDDPDHTALRAHRLHAAAARQRATGGEAELVLDDTRPVSDSAAAVPVVRAMWSHALDGRVAQLEASNRELASILERAVELAAVLDDPDAAAGEVRQVRAQAELDITAATNRAERAERAERDARRQVEEATEVRDEAVAALEEAERRTAEQVAAAQARIVQAELVAAATVERAEQEAAEQLAAARDQVQAAEARALQRIGEARAAADQRVAETDAAAQARIEQAEREVAVQLAAAQARIEQAEREAAERVEQARRDAIREHDQAVREVAAAEAARADAERLRAEVIDMRERRDREQERHEQEVDRLREEHADDRRHTAAVQAELKAAHEAQVAALRDQLAAFQVAARGRRDTGR